MTMGTIQIIDRILQNVIVRWLLLASTVILIVVAVICYMTKTLLSAQVNVLRSEKANLAAAMAVQNDAIKQAANDMAEMQKRVQEARDQATALSKKLAKRQVEIREVVLTGECPDKVQQILDEVRK